MTLQYCQNCGNSHECIGGSDSGGDSEAVTLAKLESKTRIELARIEAGKDRDWNETCLEEAGIEANAVVEAAAIEAAVIGEAIESAGVSEPDPVVIDVPGQPDPEPDVEELPPVEGSPVPTPARKRSIGLGAW